MDKLLVNLVFFFIDSTTWLAIQNIVLRQRGSYINGIENIEFKFEGSIICSLLNYYEFTYLFWIFVHIYITSITSYYYSNKKINYKTLY
jgi:hypothetical protein